MMNFSPDLSPGLAVLMVLLAANMWGTWFISLKYLGDYPIDGFYVTMFTSSLIFVWAVGLLIDGQTLFYNIREIYATDPSRVLVVLGCGMVYVINIRITLKVASTIGLSLTMPIKASINILMSTGVAAAVGGVPEGHSLGLIFFACFILIFAIFLSMQSARLRIKGQETAEEKADLQYSMLDIRKSILLMLLTTIISPAYSFGLSYSLKSVTQPNGLAVLPYMALLSTGAFLGAMLSCGSSLTIRKQWKIIFNAPFSIHKFGIISSLFHYGGNIIHTFASAYLSTVVAFPLAQINGLTTQMWGLIYGEFKGAQKSAYYYLGGSILLYIAGAFIIAQMNF